MSGWIWPLALLPLAFASGWWLHWRNSRRSSGAAVSRLSTTYFRGLNYLLNEQPDKAIEVFLKIAEVDRDTVETHFALGHLFRRRGEVDRAIRLHQNLVMRDNLSDEQRTEAVLALGEDYMHAGLYDRAETLFTDLLKLESSAPRAMKHLISIYQAEQDWQQAIEHAKSYESATGEPMGRLIAHFYCELAERARCQGKPDAARDNLRRAFDVDANSVRAGMLEGRLEAKAGNDVAAIRSFERVARNDPDFLPELLPDLLDAYRRHGDLARARSFLAEMIERYPGVSPVLAMTALVQEQEGGERALEYLTGQLRQRPSVRGQGALIDLSLAQGATAERDILLVLGQLTEKLLSGAPTYRCQRCGFGARAHHWHCPSCKNWGTVKPIHGTAGE